MYIKSQKSSFVRACLEGLAANINERRALLSATNSAGQTPMALASELPASPTRNEIVEILTQEFQQQAQIAEKHANELMGLEDKVRTISAIHDYLYSWALIYYPPGL